MESFQLKRGGELGPASVTDQFTGLTGFGPDRADKFEAGIFIPVKCVLDHLPFTPATRTMEEDNRRFYNIGNHKHIIAKTAGRAAIVEAKIGAPKDP